MILTGEQHWVCPNCDLQERTQNQGNRFHPCPGLAGLLAPMVLDGVRCRVRAVVREDYVNGEDVRFDGEGRPVMAVTVERDGGQDCAVFAPAARVRRG
ncbi:hypothetical protein [Streptomyces sp. S1D4-14]|uniref:hypothetical protein n=1 Tax=Streptomyces sp. S1D4-14 TaxID=2594461 RepID=UPI001161C6EE|nr:hypothetical protein [Streptomyces sp. S1D4-14]QDN64440.1 hypothetical protein FNV66_01000 [Streptomyces sp. S1D4-14]